MRRTRHVLLWAVLLATTTLGAGEAAKGKVCPHCGMVNCTMGCKDSATDDSGRKLMVMPGLPNWLFFTSVAGVMVLSFLVADMAARRGDAKPGGKRRNILRAQWLRQLVGQPWFQTAAQAPFFLAFGFLIYAGLFGHTIINITPIMTWTIWWGGLIFVILFLGKIWCLVCPWDFGATLVQRIVPWRVAKDPLTLGLPWPRSMRNIYPAIGLFILLTWFEIGFRVTTSPRMTAYIGLGMMGLAVVCALVFEKKSFCRYGCMVGRISGLYANFSPVEVRSAESDTCKQCTTKDCFHGNEKASPFPTGLNLATLKDNTYCIQCTECVRACPNDNVAINVRPFAADLFHYSGPRKDEAYLAVILFALTAFHGLTMTPLWDNFDPATFSVVGAMVKHLGVSKLAAFTIGMVVVLGAPAALYSAICLVTKWVSKRREISAKEIFVQFSYSLLPIALFYHLAHNGMHVFMEGQSVFTYISDPLGRGWDLFGTASTKFPPLLDNMSVWVLQVGLILVGHIYGILVAHRTAVRVYGKGRTATYTQIPMLCGMILFSFVSLWIMHLDMNMRSSLM